MSDRKGRGRRLLKVGLALFAAIALLAYGGLYRKHRVRIAGKGKTARFEFVSEAAVIIATTVDAYHLAGDGVIEGKAAAQVETTGKACPT